MSKECNLIATLPNLNDRKSITEMISYDEIDEFRFNSGVNQLMSAREIVKRLKEIEKLTKKKIWIDLKGRQLRVTSWADPNYETIELNHNINIEYPAKVVFRDGTTSEIIRCRNNKILLATSPYRALGKGQSINIDAKSLEIEGYLTELDKELIKYSAFYGLDDYMASFVEEKSDLTDILELNKNANIVSKIESVKGLEFMENEKLKLMAARDDLYSAVKVKYEMLKHLKRIVELDPNAICASKIFASLEHNPSIALSDYEDLELMHMMGYKNFMLQDDLKGPKLEMAIKGWREFKNG